VTYEGRKEEKKLGLMQAPIRGFDNIESKHDQTQKRKKPKEKRKKGTPSKDRSSPRGDRLISSQSFGFSCL